MVRDDTPTTPSRTNPDTTTTSHHPWIRWLLSLLLLFLLFVDPALAQESAVCGAEKLPGMIEGFFQLSIGIGLLGLAVVWQADSLMEMFTIEHDDKRTIKTHKRTALKSAVVLVSLGPLYTLAGSTMGLPLAECIDLVPW